MVIITSTQPFYRVLLVANSSGKRLKLAKLPDIFLSQSSAKETDFRGVQGLSRVQRGQLRYQLARTISALMVAVFQVAVVVANMASIAAAQGPSSFFHNLLFRCGFVKYVCFSVLILGHTVS